MIHLQYLQSAPRFHGSVKEVEVIPITGDCLLGEVADFNFNKVFFGGGADFHSVFLLMYVAIGGETYVAAELMYVATRFQKKQKSRCFTSKTAGFAL